MGRVGLTPGNMVAGFINDGADLRSKEVLKVINAISHDGNSTGAFPFGGGTELIPLE